MIGPCDCKNASQDRLHGKGQRVFNACGPVTNPQWRCTVCLKQIPRAAKSVVFTGKFAKKEGESKDV